MGMVNQGGMINREDLIAEIGLGDISDASLSIQELD